APALARSRRDGLFRRSPHRQRHAGTGGPGGVAPVGHGFRRRRLAGRAEPGQLGTRDDTETAASLMPRRAPAPPRSLTIRAEPMHAAGTEPLPGYAAERSPRRSQASPAS